MSEKYNPYSLAMVAIVAIVALSAILTPGPIATSTESITGKAWWTPLKEWVWDVKQIRPGQNLDPYDACSRDCAAEAERAFGNCDTVPPSEFRDCRDRTANFVSGCEDMRAANNCLASS